MFLPALSQRREVSSEFSIVSTSEGGFELGFAPGLN